MRFIVRSRSVARVAPVAVAVALFFGCVPPNDGTTPGFSGSIDIPPAPEGTLRVEVPEMNLPTGEEIFRCVFGTWSETAGVNTGKRFASSPMMHHSLFKGAPQGLDVLDGVVVDCLELGSWWDDAPTLFEWINGNDEFWFRLPEGIGFRVEAGDRYFVDSHFVNTSPTDSTAMVVYDFEMLTLDEVEAFAGTWNHDIGDLDIPQGIQTEIGECTWEADTTILNLGAHMHLNGYSYQVDWLKLDGSEVQLLDVPTWEPEFRERPPIISFPDGTFIVQAGDAFRTTCTWENLGQEPLTFPEEMCTTFGVAYPMADNIFCPMGF